MFISSENYLEQVNRVIQENDNVSLAVAFWGNGADENLQLNKPKSYRIICNLLSGGTNPSVIEKLRKHFGETHTDHIRQLNNLHAKVIVGSKSAIVGSANFSTNGLNHEDAEAKGWEEAGLLCTDTKRVEEIQAWFQGLWGRSQPITENDMENANKAWGSRRRNRVLTRPVDSFFDLRPDELKGKRIYLVFWGEDASQEAKDAFEEEKERLGDDIDFWENCPELPQDSPLISVHIGLRGGIHVSPEICQYIRDKEYTKDGRTQTLKICRRAKRAKAKEVLGMSFGEREARELKARLRRMATTPQSLSIEEAIKMVYFDLYDISLLPGWYDFMR